MLLLIIYQDLHINSRLTQHLSMIFFPDELLFSITSMSWYANIDNFFEKKVEVQKFYWDDLYMFKYGPNQIF